MKRRLEEPTSPLRYIGIARQNDTSGASLADITKALRSQVWNFWDNSPQAPPKTRAQDGSAQTAPPQLQILAWQRGRPIWPEILLSKFPENTDQHAVLESKRVQFAAKFGSAPETTGVASTSAAGTPRVGGLCDYSPDDGLRPFNFSKSVSLPAVKDQDFTVNRLAYFKKMVVELFMSHTCLKQWLGNAMLAIP